MLIPGGLAAESHRFRPDPEDFPDRPKRIPNLESEGGGSPFAFGLLRSNISTSGSFVDFVGDPPARRLTAAVSDSGMRFSASFMYCCGMIFERFSMSVWQKASFASRGEADKDEGDDADKASSAISFSTWQS